ncbi:hypothetical protein NYG90_07165 [Helicobacter sp. XJK30-2]|uniref:Uncharacterized protein n=1 Tax=Helicobacter zhangjianzhongii TaxID=2974574 RepID=A0ACC6FU39_9HELI|nr:hypothetical protein [Helicobacter sp. XJK30-2]MDL0082448.1 hypothetical protein [Helicobacter sp. XJK30-2]
MKTTPPLESTLPSQATRSPSSRADEALFLSSRASVAIHTQNKDSSRGAMDCHATASAVSRNDNKKVDSREAQILNNSAQDSKIFAKNAKNLNDSHAEAKMDSSTEANLNEPAQDSKIVELESWLFKPHKENKTRGLLTQCGDEIRDSSPQAESLILPPPPPLLTA